MAMPTIAIPQLDHSLGPRRCVIECSSGIPVSNLLSRSDRDRFSEHFEHFHRASTTLHTSLQPHDHTAALVRSARVLLQRKTKQNKARTQPQTRMRHDPTAMGYFTASNFAVPTFSPSRCYDRGHALTINVSPSRTRAHFSVCAACSWL